VLSIAPMTPVRPWAESPVHRRFQRMGSTRFIRDFVRDDGKARQGCGTECR